FQRSGYRHQERALPMGMVSALFLRFAAEDFRPHILGETTVNCWLWRWLAAGVPPAPVNQLLTAPVVSCGKDSSQRFFSNPGCLHGMYFPCCRHIWKCLLQICHS